MNRVQKNGYVLTSKQQSILQPKAKAYRFICIGEDNCDRCKSHHRRIFLYANAEEGLNYPTLHPNCDCTTENYYGAIPRILPPVLLIGGEKPKKPVIPSSQRIGIPKDRVTWADWLVNRLGDFVYCVAELARIAGRPFGSSKPLGDTSPSVSLSEAVDILATENYNHNVSVSQSKPIAGMIYNQHDSDIAQYQMGVASADYNGCGWIAPYNVQVLLGNRQEPEDVIDYFVRNEGTFLMGQFGTNPNAIAEYLEIVNPDKHVSISYFPTDIDEQLRRDGIGILTYGHSNGAHYVAIEYNEDDGVFYVYNENKGGDATPEGTRVMESILDFLCEFSFAPINLITIR